MHICYYVCWVRFLRLTSHSRKSVCLVEVPQEPRVCLQVRGTPELPKTRFTVIRLAENRIWENQSLSALILYNSLGLILSYIILSYRIPLVLSYLILSHLILSYIILSYRIPLVLSYLISSYRILSYLIVYYIIPSLLLCYIIPLV